MQTATDTKLVMEAHLDTCFMIGEVKVSPPHNTLWAHGTSIKLQPKVMAVLHYLARNQTRVISNDELIEQLWAGRVVTHGSVQKSINALRSALSELIGEQDYIAHYSKRGYQLKLEPQFLSTETTEAPKATTVQDFLSLAQSRWRPITLGVLLLILLSPVYMGISWETLYLSESHKTEFHTTQGYTNETGHERSPTPHPDNQHLAYIRETVNQQRPKDTESSILVRNALGKDWRVANSKGTWFKLAWSPAGNSLVAIEVKRRDGLPLGTRFHQPANYLYSFHIFTLDLDHERVIEKQQLSQWQGRIFSVSWWDEHTLEIVAKQGPGSGNGRYRYSIQDQQLKLLDELDSVTNPLASAVFKQKTALASLHKNQIRIDFLNAQQNPINRVQLDVTSAEISWIPNGSGVLVYAEDERKLFAVLMNGEQASIPLADTKDKGFAHPQYRADGEGIYYTEEKRSSNILQTGLEGIKTRLTENTDLNYAASFSPDAKKVAYASVRNNQINLWLIENGHEHQLTTQPIPKKVDAIVWSDNAEHLVFNAGNLLFHYSLPTNETALLFTDTDPIEPIAYFPDRKQLFVLRHRHGIRNLWRIQGSQQKQLTFGAVGSAVEYAGDVFFQYVGESGLWALRHKDESLERVMLNTGEYSKLLKADAQGIYFMEGGICQESDVYYQDYAGANRSIALKQGDSATHSTSFDIDKGLLQTECHLPEANIVLMK